MWLFFLFCVCVWKLGFLVGRTKDVIATSKNSNKVCIQEIAVVDVPVEDVRILSLSADDSILAASVDAEIHFFSVDSLLNKVYIWLSQAFSLCGIVSGSYLI